MSDTMATAIVAVLVAIPPTLAAIAAYLRSRTNTTEVRSLSSRVNGRLDELLELTRTASYAKGLAAGKLVEFPPRSRPGEDDRPATGDRP